MNFPEEWMRERGAVRRETGIVLLIRKRNRNVARFRMKPYVEYLIGRDWKKADVFLWDKRIEKEHCRIWYDEGKGCLWIKEASTCGCMNADRGKLIPDVYVKIGLWETISLSNAYSIQVGKKREGKEKTEERNESV